MSNLLRISEAASLALHTMMVLVQSSGEWVSAHDIASTLDVSENHLAKVCQRLSKAGLIEAVRGPKGGFRLSKAPADITLLDVYEAIEGHLSLSPCILGHPEGCPGGCILGDLVDSINHQVIDRFSRTTLDQICNLRNAEVRQRE